MRHAMTPILPAILAAVIATPATTWATSMNASPFVHFDTGAADLEGINLTAGAGLGFDNNVFHAPRSSYINYANAATPTVIPQKKTGFFVPYEIKAQAGKSTGQNGAAFGTVSLEGDRYLSSSLSNANSYRLNGNGGYEFILNRNGKDKNALFAGLIAEKHNQVYFHHEDGTPWKASNRYSYTATGIGLKYKHKTGSIDFGAEGKYVNFGFEPSPVSAIDYSHTYAKIGGDASFPLASRLRLDTKLAHWTEDYSKRFARDNTAAASTSLLSYTYNSIDLSLHGHVSPSWQLFLDLGSTQRTDGFMNYNDYTANRYGVRAKYEDSPVKTQLSFHHWTRNYPNAFAFDTNVCGATACAQKTYSGNHLNLKSEMKMASHSAVWAELDYIAQNTTDLRYDYAAAQFMAGMRWNY